MILVRNDEDHVGIFRESVQEELTHFFYTTRKANM